MQAIRALSSAQAKRASEAFRFLQAGDAVSALRIARELIVVAADTADAQQLLALSLAQSGDPNGAEAAFGRALQLAPEQPAILCNLALLLRRNGRRQEALACWQRAVKVAPTLVSAWLDLGLLALDLNELDQSISALQQVVQLSPGSVRAWHGLGCALRAADQLDAAEQAFRKALALDPGKSAILVNLAALLRLQGRPEESVEHYQQAMQAGAEGPDVLDALVGALLDASRPDEALPLAQQLTAQYPQFANGHVTLANVRWEHGPLDPDFDPLADFHRAALAQPLNDDLQLELIAFLLSAQRWEEALQRVLVLRSRIEHPLLVTYQANALEAMDRPQESSALYAQAHRSFGNSNPAFLNAYVRHLLKAGQWDLAAQRAEEALQTDPDNQESLAYLASAWRLLDDPREHWLCDYQRLVELLEVEVPDGYPDMPGFLLELQRSLDVLHTARREPVRQSLRSGSQTPGRLFGRPEPRIKAIHDSLMRTVEGWLARLPTDPKHPFLRRAARSVSLTGSWSVKLWTSGKHVNHYHCDGWMSSAFYVALPPSVLAGKDAHAGQLQLGQPPVELGLNLPPRRYIQPRPGYLALFPSYMWHGTVPFFDAEPRLTIAFDMLPKR